MARNIFLLNAIDSSSSDDEEERGRRPRTFLPRINFEVDPGDFRQYFRVDPDVAQYIIDQIGPLVVHQTNRNFATTPQQQLLNALHWLGHGAQYHVNASCHGLSKATVHRNVHDVCTAICDKLLPQWVRWPNDCREIGRDFEEIAGFPDVNGIIDGTLINIDAPSGVAEAGYVDRKNRHSINLTVVCGPQLQFFYASAKCPGSVHDARALRLSSLFTTWQEGWRPSANAILLGDSAYPLLPWLMVAKVRNENNLEQLLEGVEEYKRKLRITRFKVENSIGVLREEYPSLNQLRIRNPTNAAVVIMACVCLHNIQNHWRHGAYDYDERLNEIVNRELERENEDDNDDNNDDNNDNEGDRENRGQEVVDGIARQRQFIDLFNEILNRNEEIF